MIINFRYNLFNLSTKDNYVYVSNGDSDNFLGETIQDSLDYFYDQIENIDLDCKFISFSSTIYTT